MPVEIEATSKEPAVNTVYSTQESMSGGRFQAGKHAQWKLLIPQYTTSLTEYWKEPVPGEDDGNTSDVGVAVVVTPPIVND